METKKIVVLPYDPNWQASFDLEASKIREDLHDNLLKAHHVGSTSVPGLCAKPCIDIIVEVSNLSDSIEPLKSAGYIYKGELNVPFRYFFNKPDVNLHVVDGNNIGFLHLNLCFRDYLRSHPDSVVEYATLKKNILAKTDTFEVIDGIFPRYTLEKDEFIKSILEKAGFSEMVVNFCLHDHEWAEYHRIKNEQLFSVRHMPYDKNHPSINAENNFHFVLYGGTKIVSVAQVEFLNNEEAAIRGLATDSPYKNKGFGSHLLKFLERWIRHNQRNIIRLHSAPLAEHFYRSLGYVDMKFEEPMRPIDELEIDLGKTL